MSTEVRSVLGDPKLCSQLSDVKNSFTNRDCIFETIILSTNNPMLSSKLNVLSHISLPSCQIWKIPSQAGVVVCRNCLEYQQSYVIFKIEHFISYFCLSQYYLLYVYISHIFLLFKCYFDSLEWKFGTYSFM